MIYDNWGFTGNLFETRSLPASAFGDKLLVGREKEVRKLNKSFYNRGRLTTVEGANGVGKTSVVNVAAYRAWKSYISGEASGFFVPCRTIFQLKPADDLETFKFKVLAEVAQTLIDKRGELPIKAGVTKASYPKGIDRWLNSPQLVSYDGGIGPISAGLSKETNTAAGFQNSGFEKAVVDWLRDLFPENAPGAIVWTLDNLELLQTSDEARRLLEQLRDTVFNLPGLKWVLCGALGIMYGVAASPRMSGFLEKPLSIGDLSDNLAKEIYQRRVDAYKKHPKARLPLSADDFVALFDMMRGNLRDALSAASEFCSYASDLEDDGEELTSTTFEEWLLNDLKYTYETVSRALGKKAIEVFQQAASKGSFSPSDHAEFGYQSSMALRPQIKDLEVAGLLRSSQDESDKRRRNIQVTPKGWKFISYMERYPESTS